MQTEFISKITNEQKDWALVPQQPKKTSVRISKK